jgi:lipopolysaccharide transport system permease protein
MLAGVSELYQRRQLLWSWAQREIRARYKQSVLGFAWAVFQPLALSFMYILVFAYVVRVPSDGIPYPIFVYSAMLPWSYFSRALAGGMTSVVGNMGLVTKIYFPRAILPLASIGANLVDFLCGLVVLIGMMILYHTPVSAALAVLPLLLLIQIALSVGVALAGAALNVFYRDVSQMVPLILQLWMYASPIIYPISLVPERLRFWYMLNPMAVIIDAWRTILFNGTVPSWGWLGIATFISVAVLIGGFLIFRRLEDQFADVI